MTHFFSPLRLPTGCGRAAALVLALLLSAGAPALAQDGQGAGQPPPGDDSQAARFRLADRYLNAGDAERAIALLEDLYDESPSTIAFYQKLKEAYEGQKRYEEAIALVEREMQRRGRSPALLAEKARLQYHSRDEDTAFATWDAALAVAPEEPQTYRTVYGSLTDARLFQQAIEAVQKGREALGDSAAMRLQLAYLYSLTSQHEAAIGEYLAMLKENPGRLSFVKRRLNRFLEQESALQESIAATSRAVRAEPTRRAYRELMGWLYLQADEHQKALRAYRAIDRLESGNGRLLYSFAQQAADAGAYRAALDAYELILERHPDGPVAASALRGLGQTHEQWAESSPSARSPEAPAPGEPARDSSSNRSAEREKHYERALEAYRSFLDRYPQHEAYPSVLRAVGRLQQDVLFDLEAAQKTLEEVARRYPQSQAANLARYDLGRLQVMRGNLTEARLAFSRLTDRLGTGDLAQQARYQQALLHFYKGEFDAASTLLGTIAENTSADVSNDGISLGVLLSENAVGSDTTGQALTLYARARLMHRQRRQADVLALLDELLQKHGRHPIVDNARFFKAEALAAHDRLADAADAYAQIALAHPKSPLASRSLHEAARLQEQALDDPEGALQTYQRLLKDYPGSLHAPDARARIQALRAEVKQENPAS